MQGFVAALPRVHPFYAVKCHPDPAVLRTLAALGGGFDCASAAEMRMVLALGVPRDRIIFANATKTPGDLKFALEHAVPVRSSCCVHRDTSSCKHSGALTPRPAAACRR